MKKPKERETVFMIKPTQTKMQSEESTHLCEKCDSVAEAKKLFSISSVT